jgi:hypothetical protein
MTCFLLADDPVAADSILTRLLGADLTRISHIREADRFLGDINDSAISRLSCTEDEIRSAICLATQIKKAQ